MIGETGVYQAYIELFLILEGGGGGGGMVPGTERAIKAIWFPLKKFILDE